MNGKLYQPSNGSEGEWFWANWCEKCAKHPRSIQAEGQCMILMRTFVHYPDDPEYPREWCYDENGAPQCTAFKDREQHNAERRARRGGVIARDTDTIDMFRDTP